MHWRKNVENEKNALYPRCSTDILVANGSRKVWNRMDSITHNEAIGFVGVHMCMVSSGFTYWV